MSKKSIPLSKLAHKFVVFLLVALVWSSAGFSQSRSKDPMEKEMRSRLEQIKEENTKHFLRYIVTHRNYLRIVTASVHKELKLRKIEGFDISKTDWEQSQDMNTFLLSKYKDELGRVVRLYDNISRLERLTKKDTDESTQKQIDDLKARLNAMVGMPGYDNPLSRNRADQLISDYSREIDGLIAMADEIQQLKSESNSATLEDRADQLGKSIVDILEGQATSSPLVESYMKEIAKLVVVLQELDVLDKRVDDKDTDLHVRIRKIKQHIMDSVPSETLLAFGYKDAQFRHESEKMDLYFKEWLANQSFWIQTNKKQIELLRKKLILSGSEEQVKRMFEEDVVAAVSQYDNEEFAIAELLFSDLVAYYPYNKMEDIRYFYAECLWMQQLYSRAKMPYQTVAENASDVNDSKRAYYRLVLISNLLNSPREIHLYANQLMKLPSSSENELTDKAMLIAGYAAYKANDINRMMKYVKHIGDHSKYYLVGQYLQAMAFMAVGENEKAKPIFHSLGNLSKSSDEFLTAVINHSLLKNGLIYYGEKDYETALENFEKIDPEIPNYDMVLISTAWAKFRSGELRSAQKELDRLFWGYMDSKYIYEAMMLSGHCNSLLGDVNSSTRKVRYVEQSANSVALNDAFNAERNRISHLVSELDELEPVAIADGDLVAFERIRNLRDNLNYTVESLSYQGKAGLQLVEEINTEEERLRELIQQVWTSESLAEQLGRKDISKSLQRISNVLGANFLRVQDLQVARNVDIRSDYPMAMKQSNSQYHTNRSNVVQNQIVAEQRKLKQNLREANALKEKARHSNDLEALSQLEYRFMEFDDFSRRLESLKVTLTVNDEEPVDSDYAKWSDFAGFGMSEDDFDRRNELASQVQEYNSNVNNIQQTIKKGEDILAYRIAVMDEEIRALEREEISEKIAQLNAERDRYFEQEYFVDSIVQGGNDALEELDKLFKTQPEDKGVENPPAKNE